jgi:hypothetical protein
MGFFPNPFTPGVKNITPPVPQNNVAEPPAREAQDKAENRYGRYGLPRSKTANIDCHTLNVKITRKNY